MSRPFAFGVFLLTAVLGVAGCAHPPERPDEASPGLALERFFAGPIDGDGVLINSWTGSRLAFHVDGAGSWDGTTLTLREDFLFSDGDRDSRTWTFRRTAAGRFVGSRDDGVADARIRSDGSVERLAYTAPLLGWPLDFEHVLALRPDGELLNRVVVSKWGVRIGRVEMVMRRREPYSPIMGGIMGEIMGGTDRRASTRQ